MEQFEENEDCSMGGPIEDPSSEVLTELAELETLSPGST